MNGCCHRSLILEFCLPNLCASSIQCNRLESKLRIWSVSHVITIIVYSVSYVMRHICGLIMKFYCNQMSIYNRLKFLKICTNI